MNDVALRVPDRWLTEFKPEEAAENIAKAEALAEYARRIKDWPLLDAAVDSKLDEQQDFVEWWRNNVRANHRPSLTNAVPRYFVEQAEKITDITQQQVSKWAKWLGQRDVYRARIIAAAMKKALDNPNYRAEGTGDNEWYTPAEFVEAARSVMGSIDLDPASCAEAQQTVNAAAYFSEADNGLVREWRGNIWLNPPYSRDLVWQFTAKLSQEFGAGHVKQAVMLTHNNTDTAWFHELAKVSSAICFVRGRIKFYRGDLIASAPNGQVFFYLGENVGAFASAFGAEGLIMRRL